mmetsp:Transcript_24128/g.52852  ORF Transcript_24128/g.52852 Transcript_24128/m.52852 type:complete len:222 (+) Transcript_24128:80-745(+)
MHLVTMILCCTDAHADLQTHAPCTRCSLASELGCQRRRRRRVEGRARLELDDALDFYRDVQRQRVDPDGRPGVVADPVSEDLHEQIRGPVHDQVLVPEPIAGLDDPKDLLDLFDAVQIAVQAIGEGAEDVEGGLAGGLVAVLDVRFVAVAGDPSGHERPVLQKGKVTAHVQHTSGFVVADDVVVGPGSGGRGECDAEFLEALFDVNEPPLFVVVWEFELVW